MAGEEVGKGADGEMMEQVQQQVRQEIERAKEYLRNYDGEQVNLMEVCGTHTHEIFRLGIRSLLSPKIRLISGPGCPVCVTGADFIDEAVYLAKQGAIITTFGDLVRVPGTKQSLAEARADGADIRVVYAPVDALDLALQYPERQVVFLSVGFETTTPAECLAVKMAKEQGVRNFTLLTANKTMLQAYRAMANKNKLIFLYPGHVHAIIGTGICRELAEREGISGVVSGFTAYELLAAITVAVKKAQANEPFFVNAYPRVVSEEGSLAGKALMEEVMVPCSAYWRGIGVMEGSGLALSDAYAEFDARKRFAVPEMEGRENPACRCGEILQGKCLPPDCPLFGKACTPEHAVGACMVSGEGTCSAFYLYGNTTVEEKVL